MRAADCKLKYPPAPREFPADAKVFIYNDRKAWSAFDKYCGAWALPNGKIHKFTLPGTTSSDGFYSDPLAARAALEKYLKEIGR